MLIINKEELEKLGDAPKVRVTYFSVLYCIVGTLKLTII
jgi:hypothetical protein